MLPPLPENADPQVAMAPLTSSLSEPVLPALFSLTLSASIFASNLKLLVVSMNKQFDLDLEDGRRVLVIERDLSEQDRIVGELLQPEGYLKLIELGLEDCVEKIDAQQVFGYALFKDGKHTRLSYPLEKFHSDVAGRSFHNGRFIQRMREKAASLPKYWFLPSFSIGCICLLYYTGFSF
ncbi:hypothetical protein JHK85_009338 [Glycine max]|nr:hypothetical protein JHK85_009338 [Glycine max]